MKNGPTALIGATLIDGRGGAPLDDAVVTIRGDRIESVGGRQSIDVVAGADVLDVT